MSYVEVITKTGLTVKAITMQISKLIYTKHFQNNLHRVAKNQKIGKPNNIKVLESNKTKGPKQDCQNWLWSQSRLYTYIC